jgi:ABC-2 type transport system permease protein
LTIFLTNILRILRNKASLISLIVVPVFFMTMTIMLNSGGSSAIRVGVIDNDNTQMTEQFIQGLREKSNVVILSEEKEIQAKLIKNNIDYAIVVPEEFTQSMIEGIDIKLKGYKITETDASVPVIIYIESFIGVAKNIAASSMGDIDMFYQSLEAYQDGPFKANYKTLRDENKSKAITGASLGFLIMSMLFLSSFSANILLEDKRNKTFYRVLTTPMTMKEYMLQNVLSFFLVMAIQIGAVITLMITVFKLDFGNSLLSIVLILTVFAIVCVSFGVALTSLAKDRAQASSLSSLLIVPMCMLGGCFWPRWIMPEFLQKIGNLVPTTWALKAAEKTLAGQSIIEIKWEIGILLLFALVFFLLGSWKKAHVIA